VLQSLKARILSAHQDDLPQPQIYQMLNVQIRVSILFFLILQIPRNSLFPDGGVIWLNSELSSPVKERKFLPLGLCQNHGIS
jgi:hypothetical protein